MASAVENEDVFEASELARNEHEAKEDPPQTTGTSDMTAARREAQKASGGASAEKGDSEKTTKRSALLAMRLTTKYDFMRRQLPKPKNCIPPIGLRSFVNVPLRNKIPNIENRPQQMVYSRGKVSQGLKSPVPNFTLHEERILKSPYTALHDPHAKSYFSRPPVQKLLVKQGLATNNREVICTATDFNQYRDYLLEVSNGQVTEILKTNDERYKYEKQQLRASMVSEPRPNSAKKEARNQTRSSLVKVEAEKIKRLSVQRNQTKYAAQQERLAEIKEGEKLQRMETALEREIRRKQKLAASKQTTLDFQRNTLRKSVKKQIQSYLQLENNELKKSAIQEVYMQQWVDLKIKSSSASCRQKKGWEESLESETKRNAVARQKRVEYSRKMIPIHNQRRQVEKKRLMEIVRKYAMIWLNKVRDNKKKPEDPLHESVWINTKGRPNVLEEALDMIKHATMTKTLGEMVLQMLLSRAKFNQYPSELSEAMEELEEKALEAEIDAEIIIEKEAEEEALLKEQRKHENLEKQEAEFASIVATALGPAPPRLSNNS